MIDFSMITKSVLNEFGDTSDPNLLFYGVNQLFHGLPAFFCDFESLCIYKQLRIEKC